MTKCRTWRVGGFVPCTCVPDILTYSEYQGHKSALDMMWNWRSVVRSPKWLIWIEPQDMTAEEKHKYIPMDVRDRYPTLCR